MTIEKVQIVLIIMIFRGGGGQRFVTSYLGGGGQTFVTKCDEGGGRGNVTSHLPKKLPFY